MRFIARNKLPVLVLVLVLCAACIGRSYYINQKFPAPVLKTAKSGEILEYKGIGYRVKDYALLRNEEELKKQFPDFYERVRIEGYSFCYMCVNLELTNMTEKEIAAEDLYFEINFRQYGNGGGVYAEGSDDIGTGIAPEGKKSIWVIFLMNTSFADDFDAADTRVLLSTYPVQAEMALE